MAWCDGVLPAACVVPRGIKGKEDDEEDALL